jgi:hypothetical protein
LCCPGIQRIAERCRMAFRRSKDHREAPLQGAPRHRAEDLHPLHPADRGCRPTEQETLDTSTERSNGAPDAPIEHHNQNLNPDINVKRTSLLLRRRNTRVRARPVTRKGAIFFGRFGRRREAEHRLPKGWTFSEEHVQRIESEVRARR